MLGVERLIGWKMNWVRRVLKLSHGSILDNLTHSDLVKKKINWAVFVLLSKKYLGRGRHE
jgi:hypothetical protein